MGYTSPLQELFEYPARMPEILKQYFNFSVIQYAMLHECIRDAMHHGLDPMTKISPAKRAAVLALCERGLIDCNLQTGKWETNDVGEALALAARMRIQQGAAPRNRKADILQFPRSGNSA